MSSISSILNLNNTDYQASLYRKTKEEEEAAAAARERLAQEERQAQSVQKLDEQAASQKAARRVQQVEQEIDKLSMNQAQMLLELVSKKISASTLRQLEQMQTPGERGILPSAYI